MSSYRILKALLPVPPLGVQTYTLRIGKVAGKVLIAVDTAGEQGQEAAYWSPSWTPQIAWSTAGNPGANHKTVVLTGTSRVTAMGRWGLKV